MKNRSIQLSPVASLSPLIEDGKLVAFSVGFDRVVYLVINLSPRVDRPAWTYPTTNNARPVPRPPQKYRIVGLSGPQPILDITIEGEQYDLLHVQPLGDELLLASSWSWSGGGFGHNGRVYTRKGLFDRDIQLGGGINSVQTTPKGVIWTSYSDEGVFRAGSSGLVAWDSDGNMLYEYQPGDDLDPIWDCYGLNVETQEDVWLYYYGQFPLVHLHGREIKSYWKMPLAGSHAFAVSAGRALFHGGYQDHDTYQLFHLGLDGEAELATKIELRDRRGNKLIANRVVGRADAIHLISDDLLYRINVQEACVG